jgi:hypothetical protein
MITNSNWNSSSIVNLLINNRFNITFSIDNNIESSYTILDRIKVHTFKIWIFLKNAHIASTGFEYSGRVKSFLTQSLSYSHTIPSFSL